MSGVVDQTEVAPGTIVDEIVDLLEVHCDNCKGDWGRTVDGERRCVKCNARTPDAFGEPTTLYRLYAPDGKLLYVGISECWTRRMEQHRLRKPWFAQVQQIVLEYFSHRSMAETAERRAIRDERPLHNHNHNKEQRKSLAAIAEAKKVTERLLQRDESGVSRLTQQVSELSEWFEAHPGKEFFLWDFEIAERLEMRVAQVKHLMNSGQLAHTRVSINGSRERYRKVPASCLLAYLRGLSAELQAQP